MNSLDQQDIHITRGDSACFSLDLTNSDDTAYEREDGDKIIFTVYKGSTELFSTEVYEDNTVTIQQQFTNKLDYGEYSYTVTIIKSDGSKVEAVKGYKFIVESEVTF